MPTAATIGLAWLIAATIAAPLIGRWLAHHTCPCGNCGDHR